MNHVLNSKTSIFSHRVEFCPQYRLANPPACVDTVSTSQSPGHGPMITQALQLLCRTTKLTMQVGIDDTVLRRLGSTAVLHPSTLRLQPVSMLCLQWQSRANVHDLDLIQATIGLVSRIPCCSMQSLNLEGTAMMIFRSRGEYLVCTPKVLRPRVRYARMAA